MKNFTTTESHVIWRVAVDIVNKYSANVFIVENNENKTILYDLFDIYRYEYPGFTKEMYAAALCNAIDLYSRQGYINEKIPASKAIGLLKMCIQK